MKIGDFFRVEISGKRFFRFVWRGGGREGGGEGGRGGGGGGGRVGRGGSASLLMGTITWRNSRLCTPTSPAATPDQPIIPARAFFFYTCTSPSNLCMGSSHRNNAPFPLLPQSLPYDTSPALVSLPLPSFRPIISFRAGDVS